MPSSTKERNLGFAQFLAIVVAAVGIFLAWDFGRHVVETMQLAQADAAADRQLREDEQTNAQLTQLKEDISTDAWAERYARLKWHWTREDETILVPAATPIPRPTPAPAARSAPSPAPKPFWEDWLETLFGPAP